MKTLRVITSIALLVSVSSILSAAPLDWDAGASGGANGGTGNWDQTSALWFNGSIDVPWTNANNDDAIFSGTAGTVTLTENISAGDLYFTNATGNYFITNATGAEVLTVAGAIDTGGGEHTIAAPIANSGTLNKNGDGRLHLPASDSLNAVMVNQGELSIENNNSVGGSITVADGAALEFNSGTNNLPLFNANITISGSGITNSGSLRNLSGVTTDNATITLGEDNSVIYADSDSAFVYDTLNGPLTDNGNNYNLIISGNGTGNVQFQLGGLTIGGSLIVLRDCYVYLNGYTCNYKSSYVGPGATLYVENNNGFGTQPATLMTTNCIVDGGTITSGGSYTMYPQTGITVTTNGGTLVCNSGTWTTGNIYSSNTPVTFTNSGSIHPGGAAGTTLGTINLGAGAIIKNGSGDMNMTYANASLEIYSNLVLNGGSLSFNYDASGGQTSLGAVPTTLNSSNIILNGGSMHVGHSTTIGATRGIYVASGGGTIEDVVSSGGTVTINPPITGPGTLTAAQGHASVTSTLLFEAANTYGATIINSGAAVNVSGASATLGSGNTTDNGTLTFNRTGSYEYDGAISGSGVVTKTANGTVTLGGKCTYAGATTVSAGTLIMNNTNASAITVSAATLGGTGVFGGAVSVSSGATLALGLGTLSASNNVTISGNVTVSVNKSLTQSNGMAVVSGTLTGGSGTVTVTDSGPALVAGDTFQLFSKAVSGGATMHVTGGGTGVLWNNNLAVDGTISVQSVTPSKPVINQVQVSNGNFIFSGTNGTDGDTYYVLSSTNLTLPLSQWTSVSTNTFPGNGQFFITNPIIPGNPQLFYLLQVQ